MAEFVPRVSPRCIIIIFSLVITCCISNPSDKISPHCKKMLHLGGGKKPGFVAVIAHQDDDDMSWASQLPLPWLGYELHSNSSVTSSPLETVPAAFIQYCIDYYECLPSWTLFLSAHGRNPFTGAGMNSGNGLRVAPHTFSSPVTNTESMIYHPLPPSISSAILDLNLIDRGFIAVNHLSASHFEHSHPATLGFSSHSPQGSHRMAFVSEEEKRKGCTCMFSNSILGEDSISCERPWAWPLGGEFWAKSNRIRNRPIEFWQNAIIVLTHGFISTGTSHEPLKNMNSKKEIRKANLKKASMKKAKEMKGFNDDMIAVFPSSDGQHHDVDKSSNEGGVTNAEIRARSFETLWHYILGEPIYHYHPIYEYFEAMPIVPFQDRCVEGKKRLSRGCRFLKIPPPPTQLISSTTSTSQTALQVSSISNSLCVALHGDMLGVDLMVTTYAGSNLQDADHSCCRKCRSLPSCTFWVRATNSRECFLRTSFIGYGTQSNRRGMFISEFNGVFMNEL